MDMSSLFIRRPVMTTLLMLAIVLFGIIAFRMLPVAALPSVDFPTITVSASLPGANPDTMASSVATPLEQQFSTISGLSSMTSTSSLGNTQITLQFDLSRNIDAAAQDVQTAIAAAGAVLPSMPTPPTYKKVNPADQPIIYMALASDSLPLYKVDEYAETLVAQRLSMIAGVAQVNVFGSQKYAVHAQLDPNILAARGLGLEDIKNAISNGNVNIPTGNLYGHFQAFQIQANGQLTNAEQYRGLVVSYKNGAAVTLGSLGQVIDSVENDKTASWLNGRRSIVLAVMRQPGTNTVGIVDAIKKVLPSLRAQIPGSVDMSVLYDRSITIRSSVRDVEMTLLITVVLVIGVIFLFLRNASATIIPSLALPSSIIGTFAVMYALGFSLNNLTLMALTLSVGFVVDDAVVVLENIVRHLEAGEPAFEAAIRGTREIWFTVISMTLSLVAVFTPIFFMGGIIGRLFNEFAVTIGAAILISGVVSLTLTPMLCSRWLKPGHVESSNVLIRWFETGWNWSHQHYERTLRVSLDHKRAVGIGLLVMIVITGVLFSVVQKGFMPEEDTGQIMVSTEAEQGISFDSIVRHQSALADIIRHDPNVQSVMSSVGGSSTLNQGRMFITLKPLSQRSMRARDIINELRPKLARVPGIRTYLQIPPTIRIGGQLTKALYQVTLESADTKQLYQSTNKLADKMRGMAGLVDVNTDILNNAPQINIDVDRTLAASLGITEEQVLQTLADAYGMRQISTIYAPTNQYRVIVEVEPQFQLDPDALSKLYVRSSGTTGTPSGAVNSTTAPGSTTASAPTNASNSTSASGGTTPGGTSTAGTTSGGTSSPVVPLSAIAKLTLTTGPLVVNHLGQFPAATISFNLHPGYSLGTAVTAINNAARGVVTPDVTMSFQGQAQAFQQSFQNLGWLLLLATLIIYTILGMLYESFVHPVTILSGLPAAGLGALVTLMLFGVDLDIYGILGLIMLIGIVKKNAIMMIDFAIEVRRDEHVTAHDAIYQACLVRFRPIMMTTMAALMGSIPIALGLGAGGESRQPLGLAVLGGLVVSQLLTLYITPVVYMYLDDFQERMKRRTVDRGPATGSQPASA